MTASDLVATDQQPLATGGQTEEQLDAAASKAAPTLEEVAAVIGAQRSRTRKVAAVAGVAGLLAGLGGVWAYSALANRGGDAAALTTVTLTPVAAEKRDVTLYTEFAGTLGYGDAVTIVTRGAGVLTTVPATGTEYKRGAVVFAIDSEPVALMYGDLPAWRTLKKGVSDGPDVLQLETNLAALGYTDAGDMTVDDTFTAATGAALKAFETDIGQSSPDGVLEPGEVVFSQGTIRVDTTSARGSTVSSGSEVLSVALLEQITDTVTGDHTVTSASAPTQNVALTVSTDDQGKFAVGEAVTIELADGTLTDGQVATISQTPRRDGNGPDAALVVDVTVAVTTVPDTGLIEGPANVRVTDSTKTDVTMVPVRALVALAEGGYAVQVVAADGTNSYVPVETGVFQDGWVQITGDVTPGDNVLVTE